MKLKVSWKFRFNPGLGMAVAFLAMIALVTVAASQGALFLLSRNTIRGVSEESARAAAENAAHTLANLIGLLNQSLVELSGDARLAEIAAQADPALIRQEEERITRQVPGGGLVRLLPENADTLDESRSPRMGFSDLNMARNAVREATQPGIHLANTPDAHLAMARRLANGGGVILASWPLKMLEGDMGFEGACGIELRQEDLGLIYRGKPSCKEKEPAGEVAVSGAPWKIAYWTRRDVSTHLAWYAAASLVGMALIGACAFLLHRRVARCFREDRQGLIALVKDLLSGETPADRPFKLAEMNALAHEISVLGRFALDDRRPLPPSIPSEPDLEGPESTLFEQMVALAPPIPPDLERELAGRVERKPSVEVSPAIFRACDIRGVVGETLTPDAVYAIGLALAAEMDVRGEKRIAVAQDGRLAGPDLLQSLARGLMDGGRTVVDLGLAPTPVLYYATFELGDTRSGAILTGSHDPPNYNGLKIVIDRETLAEEGIQQLRRRIEWNNFIAGVGKMESANLIPEYIERVVGDIQLGRRLKIVMDCGNGAAAVVAPELVRSLGCELIELCCEVDGRFPNHPPDPSRPENLQGLIDKVRETGADLGVAFDGDGDRLGLVDSGGKIIRPDRQMMLFAADVLSRHPGADIIYDVRCSRHLPGQIAKSGGRPLMWKSGYAAIKAKLKETGAMLAGELGGRFFFHERWYGFDDGIYACARMIEILSNERGATAEVFARLPDSVSTPELVVPLEEGESLELLDKLRAIADFPDTRIIDIDGLRVDFPEGWGLVRASNTKPALTFRFEADSEKSLAHIQEQFKALLQKVKPDIQLPF